MKKILLVVVMAITGCSNVHHEFMNKAYVGNVNGHALVLFKDGTRNGINYYRPQFQSDCGKVYQDKYSMDNNSITCSIRESRISNLHKYY